MVAVLTSSFTLDAQNSRARDEMYAQADLVSTVRLPTGSMRRNAGTDALIALLILRKHEEGKKPGSDRWIRSSYTDVEGTAVPINEFFQNNPDHVLGAMSTEHGTYGHESPSL